MRKIFKKYLKLYGRISIRPLLNRYWLISNLEYDYAYFTCSFLNDVAGLILYSTAKGFKPIIDLDGRKEGWTNWDTFFEQPFGLKNIDLAAHHSTSCTILKSPVTPSFNSPYNPKDVELWTKIYSRYIRFNSGTKRYCERDLEFSIGDIGGENILGVCARGTDYIKTKPIGHPIQPSVQQMIDDAISIMKENGYSYIYLATEDSKIVQQFEKAFPNKILTNKRTYYDEIYDKNNCTLLWEVNFDRDNDLYLKGLEYLSSIYILSKCDSLLAGNCGGSCSALYMNNKKYKSIKIYDLGTY